MKRSVCVLVFAGLVFAALCSGQKTSTRPSAPASQPSGAAVALTKMKSLMDRPRGMPRGADMTEVLKRRFPKALAVLAEMEQKYPKARELHEARLIGTIAAIQLARTNEDTSMSERAKQIVGRLLASDAPVPLKLRADAHLLLLSIRPVRAATTMPSTQPAKKVDTTKVILQFTKRYTKTDLAVDAIAIGIQIASIVDDQKTSDKLLQQLVKDYSDDPRARQVLRQSGKNPDIGQPFTATLTKLDGTKLNLPKDLRGKVVVIDFWATRCGPCVRTIPHLKSLYAKYKSQGVEIVGISLDRDVQRLKLFVATNKLDWIITCSGRADNPTAQKYGIRSIPSIWVIGKDGKVITNNARRNLTETIEKALKATITRPKPTTRPTTRPATTTRPARKTDK